VVVGNGVAGYTCAARLSRLGVPAVLVGPGPVADRPPLTKRALADGRPRLLADADRLAASSIERLDGVAVAVDLVGRNVTVEMPGGRQTVAADHLVLAPGLDYTPPPVPGLDRAFLNATPAGLVRLAPSLAAGPRRVLVVGAGLIGVETAATLARGGHDVHLVDQTDRPMGRIHEPVPTLAAAALTTLGVRFTGGVGITAVQIDDGSAVVATRDHGELVADLVVAATGGRPPTLPGCAGLSFPARVDEGMRLSGHDGVFVVGDAAVPVHVRYGEIRSPHWDTAVRTAEVAARRIAGDETARFDTVPYWWSDIGPLSLAELGHAGAAVEWGREGAWYVGRDDADLPVAILVVDAPRLVRPARELLAAAQHSTV